jgi:glycosyltransferase involved in cell wall biosynthesis
MFSICIPAYNRACYLRELLDSIFSQDFSSFRVVICEDDSPQRNQITEIAEQYVKRWPDRIDYFANAKNFGFDGNLRELVRRSTGRFCFFMGNDDILCPGALSHTAELIERHENVGMVLKSYAWFDGSPDRINQTVRYFEREVLFQPGREAIGVCFRRSGVISGYVIDREEAQKAATDKFDGTLYYQMHLTASVLCRKAAIATPKVLVLCRNGEPPDFGNSERELAIYTPGRYTPQARLNMIGGALAIIKNLKETCGIDLVDDVTRDYANYFYLCIRDQLSLAPRAFWELYRKFAALGFSKYPSFHAYCIIAYILGQKNCDNAIRLIRRVVGHSPRWGTARSV